MKALITKAQNRELQRKDIFTLPFAEKQALKIELNRIYNNRNDELGEPSEEWYGVAHTIALLDEREWISNVEHV